MGRRPVIGRALALAFAAVVAAGCDGLTTGPGTTVTARPHGAGDPHAALGPDKLLEVALQHQFAGRPGEAMDVLARAIEKHPGHAGLLGARGALNLERRRYSEALSDLEAAVKVAPDNPAVLTNRAQAYRQFERVEEAIADLDRALEIDPDFVPARFNRGTMLFTRGEYARALADFDHCIAVEPHAAAPYFNRAVTRDAMGDPERAIPDLERFLELTENEAWRAPARELLARLRARSNKTAGSAPAGAKPGG